MVAKIKTKWCTGCERDLPIDEFGKCQPKSGGLQSQCKKCASQYKQEWYLKNWDKVQRRSKKYNKGNKKKLASYKQQYQKTTQGKKVDRRGHLKYQYGLTPEYYQQMYVEQNGCCGICGEHRAEKDYRSEEKRHFDIDHDPNTGEVRGLLCWGCNMLLGRYENGCNFKKELVDQFEEYLAVGV